MGVSSLLSNFFVAAYALVNFSVFHASITKSPGWRPAFKYYSPWMSLLGVVLCVFSMFAMDWFTALLTFLITAVLYLYIYYRKPEANWGSSAQAQVFVNALKGVQSLTDTPEHVKNYRPKVLVLTGNPAHRPPLVDFANLITKKLSLLICGHVITEPGSVHLATLKESTQAWLTDKKIKGFYTVTESNTFEEDELDRETRNMAALLAKFRIEFSSVVVIPDVTKRASDSTRARLDTLLGKIPKDTIPEEELLANKEKTNRHLRLAELLQGHSKDSEIIVMTLPMPRKGNVSSALYMAWLDIMTENLPPPLLIRGNQTSVLTFYS